jgi:hypothetical protein
MIIHRLNGFLYTLEPWRFYFYLKSKTGQWVVDPTKYWVTIKTRYGGLATNPDTNAVIVIQDPSSALIGGRENGRPNKNDRIIWYY